MKILIWLLIVLLALLLLVPTTVSYSANTPLESPENSPRVYAQERVIEAFGSGWAEFDQIVQKESNWNHLAQNPKSSAFGFCQFLSQTWKDKKTESPYRQIDECIIYISERYGYPQEAWHFHQHNNWF